MVLNDATGGGACNGVMARDVARDATDGRALQAPFCTAQRRHHGGARPGDQRDQYFLHFDLPVENSTDCRSIMTRKPGVHYPVMSWERTYLPVEMLTNPGAAPLRETGPNSSGPRFSVE